MPQRFLYSGRRLREISFPLGGIGTGCVGLAGNGRLIDWEIFNRPNKGGYNGHTHFAVKAERDGRVLDARVLNGDLHPPYTGQLGRPDFNAFGFGPPRQSMAGMPHFARARFQGEFPIATLRLSDPAFPGRVALTAFNPFLPLEPDDSAIPAAFFEIAVRNTDDAPLDVTVAATLANPLPGPQRHTTTRGNGRTALRLTTDGLAPDDLRHGDLTLAVDSPDADVQEFWYRGSWFDDLEVFWRDFTTPGPMPARRYDGDAAGAGNHGTVAVRLRIAPGKSARVRFVLAWSFPNRSNDWSADAAAAAGKIGLPNRWRNHYATRFADSGAAADYALAHWKRLYDGTKAFHDALFASDLPAAALDAVSANLAVLKSPTVLRLEDGTFYGWEGCHPGAGCCEGSCTHVWNYAQALPFLFPGLERSMRDADFRHNRRGDGGMPFRLQLPLGAPAWAARPCADGQFGGVMKAYRDWKICGDTAWLRGHWDAIKAAIAFAWHPDNPDRWDPERTGVLWGRQHHTLDMELFGPSAWLNGFYLGALKAGAEMAEHLGEPETAALYRDLFARGKAWTDTHLFNGDHYVQRIDLADRALVASFGADDYWSAEHGQIKYQIGEGCEIDQTVAQWHANLYGLGEIFDPDQNRRALAALFRHNFQKPIRNFANPWRIFCVNDEGGLVMCTWPDAARKPAIPLTYGPETMHGFEYAAAIQMLQAGLVDEGMTVVAAVRERYDGERRNPWNEIECGSNYARSMASYALLQAFSGFTVDRTIDAVGFAPLRTVAGRFRCFWCVDGAWGEFEERPDTVQVRVLHGALPVRRLRLPQRADHPIRSVTLGAAPIAFSRDGDALRLDATIAPGTPLTVAFAGSVVGGDVAQ